MTIKKTTLKKRTTKTRRSPNNRILLLGILFVVCCFFCVSFSSFVGSPEYEAQVLYDKGEEHLHNGEYDDAIQCYKQAAEKGHLKSYSEVGWVYEGYKKDTTEALKWYRKGAELGDDWSFLALADCYKKGNGVPRNMEKALEYYRIAAEKGNQYALSTLADCYKDGNGVPQNKGKAIEFYRKAAEKGNEYAKERLKELQ